MIITKSYKLVIFLLDKGFQDAVERREANELIYLLKINLHLVDEDEKHRDMTKQLSLLLAKNYPKVMKRLFY